MKTEFKVGDRVTLLGHQEIGTITGIAEDYATVQFEPRPGTVTVAYYPLTLLTRLPDALPGPPKVRPKATAADVLPKPAMEAETKT